ncbi:MAG: BlaI/MecI/CopY family transcriptional regulator [Chloroflexi bacterium]|nr:BlaI/MecI/CopY family transcriptional regulator [Chloroflexota bacterium]
MAEPLIRSFKLQGVGPTRLLGRLEASVMEAVWKLGVATVQDVCDALGPDCNYKTVMTVLNRLVNKGILSRQRVSKAYSYSPVESRGQFLEDASRSVVGALVKDFGRAAIAQFVDIVNEVAPDQLAELETLAREKRRV